MDRFEYVWIKADLVPDNSSSASAIGFSVGNSKVRLYYSKYQADTDEVSYYIDFTIKELKHPGGLGSGTTVRVSFLFLVTFLSFLSKKKRKTPISSKIFG